MKYLKLFEDYKSDDVINKIWYHGSTNDITKDDLDPLYRHSQKYKDNYDFKHAWQSTGSSDGGIGIYFGSKKDEYGPFGALQYSGFNNHAPGLTQGFIYEMKLKPNANIQIGSGEYNLANLSMNSYNELRKNGVDGLIDNLKELNLINSEAVEYFKKIEYWKEIPVIYPMGNNGKPKRDKAILFDNEEELKNYLTKNLGEGYDTVDLEGRTLYMPKERNGVVLERGSERKWFK
jgi:hypothetical protein